MKTTQAILKSQDLLLPKYNKYNITGADTGGGGGGGGGDYGD